MEKIYTDPVLLLQIAAGDETAFSSLVRDHWKNVYAHALSWIKTVEEAEELTQDIFLKVWNSRSQFDQVESFENWLFIIARNTIVSAVRKRLNRPTFLADQEIEENSLSPDRLLENRQHYQVLLTGIGLLPEKRQQVFRMSRLEGLTHAQIADRLGISKDTVAQYIVKATNFLKPYLKEQLGDCILVIILLAGLY